MRTTILTLCLLALATSANAQYGVSNARDGNGNLIRNTGVNPPRNYDQQPVNNAPAGVNRAAPAPARSSTGVVQSSTGGRK